MKDILDVLTVHVTHLVQEPAMASRIWFPSNKLAGKGAQRPWIELLEDRCVPDATGLILPPGQDIFQFTNAVLQNFEASRTQANGAINALETKQLNDFQATLTSLDQFTQALIAQVTQARQQLNTDIVNGESLQTQFSDLQKIQQDGAAAGAGIAQVSQIRQAVIQQTVGQLQLDAQLRFSINQMINQQESSFLNAVIPAINAALPALIAAQQAIISSVGPPLTAGQSATYAGTYTSTSVTNGITFFASTNLTVTFTVGADGSTLSASGTAVITESNSNNPAPSSFTASVSLSSGGLSAPNQIQAGGNFSYTLQTGSIHPPVWTAPWGGLLGADKLVGQITDPATFSQVPSPFSLSRVG
jgi:hypothetical protein